MAMVDVDDSCHGSADSQPNAAAAAADHSSRECCATSALTESVFISSVL